jgi:GAF domain-containing protein
MNSPWRDELSLLRLRYLQVITVGSIALAAVLLIPVLLDSARAGALNSGSLTIVLGFIALNAGWLSLANSRYRALAGYGELATLTVVTLVAPIEIYPITGILALVTAAVIANTTVYVLANGLVLGKIALDTIQLVLGTPGVVPENLSTFTRPMIMLAFVSIVIRYFLNGGRRAVANSRSTADLLQATADVGQVVSQILNLDELLDHAVNLIRTRFKHYHVQIFMVNDTRDQALLVASTGDIGKRLLERGHQLAVGSQSVIGQVVLRGAPVVVNDTHHDPVYYQNELLPDTRAELALPIRDGAQIIGVLDIQGVHANAFGQSDLQALQIMTDLLATAIRNARLFKQQAETAQENERLYRDSVTNLREIQRLNQQLTRSAWQEYQLNNRAATGVTLEHDRMIPATEWSESLIRAGEEGRIVEADDSHKSVAVPLMLRGEVIGAIEVEPGTETSQETVEMVQAVANRLALSLENARLYEATLQAAAQEQRINDIAARFQSVATVDELLRITLAELSETLGAERGSIRLGRFSMENGGTPS